MEYGSKLVFHVKGPDDVCKLKSFQVKYRAIDIIINNPRLSKRDVIEMLRDYVLTNHFRTIKIWVVRADEDGLYNNYR